MVRGETMQSGMTLIEVLVALLIFSVGILGVAMLQLNALKYTDSSMRSLHVSFIAHDLFERIRANPGTRYALSSLSQAPTSGSLAVPRQQDLYDFAAQLKRAAGDDAEASIAVAGSSVTLTLTWDDSRASQDAAQKQTLTLTADVSAERVARP
ncbi:MAG: type IV pilus modification protein PilV [Janthinobacterium lividum]